MNRILIALLALGLSGCVTLNAWGGLTGPNRVAPDRVEGVRVGRTYHLTLHYDGGASRFVSWEPPTRMGEQDLVRWHGGVNAPSDASPLSVSRTSLEEGIQFDGSGCSAYRGGRRVGRLSVVTKEASSAWWTVAAVVVVPFTLAADLLLSPAELVYFFALSGLH